MSNTKPLHILIVDDDEDDIFFATRALERSRFPSIVDSVPNGVEMMDFLQHKGAFATKKVSLPDIILLDLNMPKKNGKEALADIRANPTLKHLPVILFTTSGAEQDILTCYQLGANSYIRKPVNFDAMVETMDSLKQYWLECSRLPSGRRIA